MFSHFSASIGIHSFINHTHLNPKGTEQVYNHIVNKTIKIKLEVKR